MATSQPEERQGLLTSSIESQQTPVLGGPLVSVPVLFLVVIPAMIATVVICFMNGLWFVSVGIIGLVVLFVAVEAVILLFHKNTFQLWALQRPWNLISRLLLPLVEIVDSIGAGNTNNCMLIFNQYGKNFCASGEVWLGSHSEVKKSVQNPQGRNYWLGEHPLLPSSVPHGEGGRCVFLLSLASKAVGGTGDHEAFRKCVVDTLLSDASVARESDSISKEVMDSLTADFAKIESGFDFYNSPVGGNQEFWTKYLHHVLFGLDIKNKEVMDTLNSFFTGDMALMHYLYPFGYVPHFNLHSKIEKVAELYEKSPAFKNFKVKAEYNNMTAKELALLMTSIMRIAGVQGSRMLAWFCTSGVIYGNLRIDAREVWDTIDLTNEDDLKKYVLEVSRLSPPVTVSHRVAMEDFSCEIAGKTYNFPKGTKVAIPLVFANIDQDVWGADVWDFKHKRPGLEKNHAGFNSVDGVGNRECPGKGLVMRTMVRILQDLGKERRKQKASA
mmetsp:Transcript_22500/g.53023  ORF Transcript_22500/g.53023 Transcript_22500/m.53023 type:complete len:498 (+) Transcript_22500:87-1580(+)